MTIPTPPAEPTGNGSMTPPAAIRRSPGKALFDQGEAALMAHDAAAGLRIVPPGRRTIERIRPGHGPAFAGPLANVVGRRGPIRTPPAGQAPSLADTAAPGSKCWPGRSPPTCPQANRTPCACARTIPSGRWPCWRRRGRGSRPPAWTALPRDQLSAAWTAPSPKPGRLIEQNRPQIELAEKNNHIRAGSRTRQRRMRVEVGEKLAMLIDQFNKTDGRTALRGGPGGGQAGRRARPQ